MFRLIITRDKDKVNETFFDQIEVTIGRQQDNDVCLHDSTVSSHHARLRQQEGLTVLEDIGSTNGTYVNGKRINRCNLNGTEVIVIGKHQLRLQDIPAAAATERKDPTQQLNRRELESLLAAALRDQPRQEGLRTATARTLNWIAQDSGGTWWGFENCPECTNDTWTDPQSGHRIRLKDENPNAAWRDTLQQI